MGWYSLDVGRTARTCCNMIVVAIRAGSVTRQQTCTTYATLYPKLQRNLSLKFKQLLKRKYLS